MGHSDDKARCIPILASLDLDETAAFYEQQLGFEVARLGNYLIARRDEIKLHFWLTASAGTPRTPPATSAAARSSRSSRSTAPRASSACRISRCGRGT